MKRTLKKTLQQFDSSKVLLCKACKNQVLSCFHNEILRQKAFNTSPDKVDE